ncbi:MAG: acyl-CoA dehydrogenase family protein [Rubrivivax sp.]|nr:acyl-CoA dehydrogenase family protein [Rubrivivax sp.]
MNDTPNDELDAVRHEAQRLLREQVDPQRLEAMLDAPGSFDRTLWQLVAGQGWPAVALAEDHGGAGLGWDGLAVLQEAIGHANAALPLAATALALAQLRAGGDAQALSHWADGLRDGTLTACLALPALDAGLLVDGQGVRCTAGRLTGCISTVAFGAVADLALVAAQDQHARAGLWLLALNGAEVTREVVATIDDARGLATLRLAGAPAVRVGDRAALAALLDRAVTLCAFEQLGGAQASLALAIAHAQQRIAFGQPIARFQAIKHKLVEIYAAIEIARGCALTALALLDEGADAGERHEAAAAARLGSNHACELAARDCINVFGALGVTREAAPHRHYRRARALALELGSSALWRESLVDHFLARHAVAPTA